MVRVLSKTILSPSFCLFLPLTLYSQVKQAYHPAVICSTVWTALVCLISTSHLLVNWDWLMLDI